MWVIYCLMIPLEEAFLLWLYIANLETPNDETLRLPNDGDDEVWLFFMNKRECQWVGFWDFGVWRINAVMMYV